jgi:hypothetical protein
MHFHYRGLKFPAHSIDYKAVCPLFCSTYSSHGAHIYNTECQFYRFHKHGTFTARKPASSAGNWQTVSLPQFNLAYFIEQIPNALNPCAIRSHIQKNDEINKLYSLISNYPPVTSFWDTRSNTKTCKQFNFKISEAKLTRKRYCDTYFPAPVSTKCTKK